MSNHVHQQYSLPGVMHYLQTEFTKNERDRITWELERSEMKSYIMKLESENKDLRHKLAELQVTTNSISDIDETKTTNAHLQKQIDSKRLTRSKAAVEESVKEIIHLLNPPTVASQFESLNERTTPVHDMENLVINKDSQKQPGTASLFTNKKFPVKSISRQDDTISPSRIERKSIIPHEKQFLNVFKNNILVTLDDKLKIFQIDEEFQCNDTGISVDILDIDAIMGIYWLSNEFILLFDDDGIKIWSAIQQKIINEISIFSGDKGSNGILYDDIDCIDFKNKWLLLTIGDRIEIFELDGMKEPHMMLIKNRYTINSRHIMDVLLGITEMSLIVLSRDSLSLIMYDFNSKVLGTVKLDNEVSDSNISKNGKLYLNKESSKLIIQLEKHLIFYSFDQKRIISQYTLDSLPTSMYFKYSNDMIGIAYSNGGIELRELSNFEHVIKDYIHNPESDFIGDKDIIIETTRINDFETILLSLGENVLKLEASEKVIKT